MKIDDKIKKLRNEMEELRGKYTKLPNGPERTALWLKEREKMILVHGFENKMKHGG